MNRKEMLRVLAGAVAALPVVVASAGRSGAAAARSHRIAIQVSTNDATTMNLALNNARNVFDYYAERKEAAAIEIVAYGPGLHMLRADTSPVKERLQSLAAGTPQLKFAACANTLHGMEKAEGKEIPLLPEAKVVPAGVVRLAELQEQRWSYIRP